MTTNHIIKSEVPLRYVRVKHANSPRYLIREFSITETDWFYCNLRCQAQNLPIQGIKLRVYVHLLDKQKDEVWECNKSGIESNIYKISFRKSSSVKKF